MKHPTLRMGDVVRSARFADLQPRRKNRTKAEYVVENTFVGGGGCAHGPHDRYPDGLHVNARRLKPDGEYDPEGEAILFSVSGCFTHTIDMEEVEVVGRMQIHFVKS